MSAERGKKTKNWGAINRQRRRAKRTEEAPSADSSDQPRLVMLQVTGGRNIRVSGSGRVIGFDAVIDADNSTDVSVEGIEVIGPPPNPNQDD